MPAIFQKFEGKLDLTGLACCQEFDNNFARNYREPKKCHAKFWECMR